jgi:hypothetical protein
MADKRAERIAKLIKPLRVEPGSKVNLAKDFDPGYKAGYVKKKDASRLMEAGAGNAGNRCGSAGRNDRACCEAK